MAAGETSVSALPLASIEGAIEFIFTPQYSNVTGGKKVGGIEQVLELALKQLELTALALALAIAIGLPIGLYLGHRHRFETFALAVGTAGRGIPELILIAFFAAAIGVGLVNVAIALAILGIGPILANAFVGVHQVDPASVDAARGMGMSEREILRKVEIPLALPTLMGGVRSATIAIVATATIAPLGGYETLGDFIINENVYGENGVLAGAILVALLAVALELALAGVQRLLTSPGLKLRPA
jgi:osmoprotectant transport system permease protein